MSDEMMAVDPVSGELLPIEVVNVAGKLRLRVDLGAASVTLTPSEIEIGHVALKNNQTEEHQTVAPDGQAVDGTHALEGAAIIAHDEAGNRWRIVRVDPQDNLQVALPNRPTWDIIIVDTGVAATLKLGPDQAVPNGYKVAVRMADGNAEAVFVAPPALSGTVNRRVAVDAGDFLPFTIGVDNLNQLEFQAPNEANQFVQLILEKIS